MPGQGHGLQMEDNVPRRLRACGNGKDVFAMVKLTMSDSALSQPPLLVYPQSLLATTERFWNTVNKGDVVLTQSLEQNRVDDLNQLASRMDADFSLWIWLRPRLREAFPGAVCDKHEKMFWEGTLGNS